MATDIVFLFDTTGSMDTYITNVANAVSGFVDFLKSGKVTDYKLGIVSYEYSVDTNYDFTTDVETFQSQALAAAEKARDGGGTEYGLTALQTALNIGLRDNASKEFIVVTDEGYDENDSYYTGSFNKENTLAALKAAGVKVDVLGLLAEKDPYAEWRDNPCQVDWESFANATYWIGKENTTVTGKFYDITATANYGDIFRDLADKIIDEEKNNTGQNTDTESFTHQLSLAQWNFGFNPVSYTASDTTAAALIVGSPAETELSTSAAIMDEFAAARLSANAAEGAMASVNNETAGNDNGVIPITFGA